VLGIDISAQMLAAARRHTAGLGGVRLVRGDAQTHPFAAGGYDVVISRFGMGHFADPSSALRNIGAALRPRGRLVFTEWGEGAANEWMTLADEVGATAVGRRWRAAPAMLSASERLIRAVGSAGLAVISVEAVVEPLCVGQDVADVLAWFETLPDSRPLRVLSNTDRHAYLVALGAELEARRTSAGILLGASAWLVTAHRPANR
jgi:SAM-dependent methyltransferase